MWWLASVALRVPGWCLVVVGLLDYLGDQTNRSLAAATIGVVFIAAGREAKWRGIAARLDREDRALDRHRQYP